MNCLIITELFWPEGSGAELATYLYAKLLSQRGINVTVLTGSLNRMTWEGNGFQIIPWVPSIKPQTKYSSLILASCLVRKPYRTFIENADVVYISKCCWAIPMVKNLGKPVVISVHEYSPICPTATLYNWASKAVCNERNLFSCLKCIQLHDNEKVRSLGQRFLSPFFNTTLGQIYGKLLSQADAILFVSNYQQEEVIKKMPHIFDRSHVVYNPVPFFEEEEKGRKDYGFYGGNGALKGYPVLLEALRNLAKPVKVHVAGRMKKGFKIESPLLTYHGWLSPLAYLELLKSTIATIFPSICPETFSYVVVESMLFGNVVIGSAIGGVPEITKGAPGVLLFPAGDSCLLAERIEQVESMGRDALFGLGRGNRDFARHRFRNDETIDGFIRILNKVFD